MKVETPKSKTFLENDNWPVVLLEHKAGSGKWLQMPPNQRQGLSMKEQVTASASNFPAVSP